MRLAKVQTHATVQKTMKNAVCTKGKYSLLTTKWGEHKFKHMQKYRQLCKGAM